MLIVNIIYGKQLLPSNLTSLGLKINKQDEYTLFLPSTKRETTIKHIPKEKSLLFQIPDTISLDDCKVIYEITDKLVNEFDGKVNDTNALLGYDDDGNKVYIYHGFPKWSEYINNAKLKSLEGQMVTVSHGEEVLGEGLMLTYEKKINPTGEVFIHCALLTSSGEQSFFGENLEILPITQW